MVDSLLDVPLDKFELIVGHFIYCPSRPLDKFDFRHWQEDVNVRLGVGHGEVPARGQALEELHLLIACYGGHYH